MAEEQESSPSHSPSPPRQNSPPPPYVEVNCRSSGKIRRFAVGTDAGFAVALINRKLKGAVAVASHIEAVKDGEEPIAFGPTSLLSNFGAGWNLQTVTLTDLLSSEEVRNGRVQQMAMQAPGLVSGVPGPTRRVSKPVSFVYIVKIVFAFILIFVLGAIFTLFLDNLPAFILFVKSII
ncbi:uncharacterized protein LOC113867450 isoform X2 [Abrus precatorius]|uniref:Uncharacterized protein LOC113867450 isoform X2 n=1 Tax=Abrus precatorius TaxID=3816 RepID=A0A8B8LUM3_ABRPR|nr:uncharacterized protein LOC113867450 isoform X2 [Abrus precatorius]